MGTKSLKGGDFERQFCRRLSTWWSGGDRDDLFWRTGGSGGMATRRIRTGKAQKQGHGDIAAVDPLGAALTETVTWELKRGYPQACPWSMLEGLAKKPPFADFLQQADETRQRAQAATWAIVHKRDRRHAMIYLPWYAWQHLAADDVPHVHFTYDHWEFRGATVDAFLARVSPVQFDNMMDTLTLG